MRGRGLTSLRRQAATFANRTDRKLVISVSSASHVAAPSFAVPTGPRPSRVPSISALSMSRLARPFPFTGAVPSSSFVFVRRGGKSPSACRYVPIASSHCPRPNCAFPSFLSPLTAAMMSWRRRKKTQLRQSTEPASGREHELTRSSRRLHVTFVSSSSSR